MQAHCPKCKISREISNAQVVKAANGKPLTRGTCAVCGSVLMRVMETTTDDRPQTTDHRPLIAETGLSKGARDMQTETKKNRAKKSAAPKRATRSRRARAEDDDLGEESISNLQFPTSASGAALVIVESPAKAKTISKFLGRNYRVRASVGHIRDLPRKDLGVDLEHDFKPKYEITAKKRDVVNELREYAQGAREIYLATDPDREGEAISWHLAAVLKNQIAGKPIHRVEFHEITKDAIQSAFSHPRALDMGRVDAQQARRVLDRIVGYTISPLLAKKMKKWTLSAGRVQSVAVRLVVEREREIQNFVAVEYWSIEAELKKQEDRETGKQGESISHLPSPFSPFRARLVKVADKDFECHSGGKMRLSRFGRAAQRCNAQSVSAVYHFVVAAGRVATLGFQSKADDESRAGIVRRD